MHTCMDKYKNDFAIRFAQVMQKELPRWKSIQNSERRRLYTSNIKHYLFAFYLVLRQEKEKEIILIILNCIFG